MNDYTSPRDLEEMMRFDPEEGILDLDRHLDRLKASAEAQGLTFDRHAARREQMHQTRRTVPERYRRVVVPTPPLRASRSS